MYRNIFENDGRLKIIKNDRVYVLPDGWELDDAGSYDFSLKLQDRAFSHGSYAVGDGYVKGRTVKVSFDLKRESEKDHDEIVNGLLLKGIMFYTLVVRIVVLKLLESVNLNTNIKKALNNGGVILKYHYCLQILLDTQQLLLCERQSLKKFRTGQK